jgi:tRNA nucleotidyltransferase (CCA-adding enzyme)
MTTALTLSVPTAGDLMSRELVTLPDTATAEEATAVLTAKGVSGALVLDAAGRPVGVLSRSDLLIHAAEAANTPGDPPAAVRDLMTPVVFSIRPDAPARRVVEELLSFQVHRLFVVDEAGHPLGVITPMDIIRALR